MAASASAAWLSTMQFHTTVPMGCPKSAFHAEMSRELLALTYSVIWATQGSDCLGLPPRVSPRE